MKTFIVFRPNAPETHTADQKNPPNKPQFQGVVFNDGTVVIRWMTARPSTAIFASMADLFAVHGHPEYGSIIVWGRKEFCDDCPNEECSHRRLPCKKIKYGKAPPSEAEVWTPKHW